MRKNNKKEIYLKYYNGIHSYNRAKFKKTGKCFDCKENKKTDWSLQKNSKHKKGVENYRERCEKCHAKYDTARHSKKGIIEYKGKSIKKARVELIWDLFLEDYSYAEIAKIFNINRSSVMRTIKSEPLFLPSIK